MAKKAIVKEKIESELKPEKTMPTKELIERAKKELVNLTGFKFPAAVGFKEEEGGLAVTIEVLEKESIPNGMDILGIYNVRIDKKGDILSYERVDLRKRGDTALVKEE